MQLHLSSLQSAVYILAEILKTCQVCPDIFFSSPPPLSSTLGKNTGGCKGHLQSCCHYCHIYYCVCVCVCVCVRTCVRAYVRAQLGMFNETSRCVDAWGVWAARRAGLILNVKTTAPLALRLSPRQNGVLCELYLSLIAAHGRPPSPKRDDFLLCCLPLVTVCSKNFLAIAVICRA